MTFMHSVQRYGAYLQFVTFSCFLFLAYLGLYQPPIEAWHVLPLLGAFLLGRTHFWWAPVPVPTTSAVAAVAALSKASWAYLAVAVVKMLLEGLDALLVCLCVALAFLGGFFEMLTREIIREAVRILEEEYDGKLHK